MTFVSNVQNSSYFKIFKGVLNPNQYNKRLNKERDVALGARHPLLHSHLQNACSAFHTPGVASGNPGPSPDLPLNFPSCALLETPFLHLYWGAAIPSALTTKGVQWQQYQGEGKGVYEETKLQ